MLKQVFHFSVFVFLIVIHTVSAHAQTVYTLKDLAALANKHSQTIQIAQDDLFIAKMDEKGIKLDPGLTSQIHLVNNVRIFSVHKKQRTFKPTKHQTKAIMLYTLDVVGKLF